MNEAHVEHAIRFIEDEDSDLAQVDMALAHEVEEAFFVLEGELTVFFQDEDGKQAANRMGQHEVALCPAGIPHGFVNEGDTDALVQVMIGTGKPGPIGFIDDGIYEEEIDRLASRASAPAE